MSGQTKWDELYEEASREVLRWRRKHKRATLTEIEETGDSELARMRAEMIEEQSGQTLGSRWWRTVGRGGS